MSFARRRSSSLITSPWKSGCSKPRTSSWTGPIAMNVSFRGFALHWPGGPSGASPQRDERPPGPAIAAFAARSLRSQRHRPSVPERRDEHGLDRVQPVLRLVEDERERRLEDVVGHLQRVDAELGEQLFADLRL